MQDSEQSSSSSSSSRMLRVSVVLSFVVAVFAIVSLIAVGFNQISFAAPLENNTFKFYQGTYNDGDPIQIIASDHGSAAQFYVPIYLADNPEITNYNAVPIFCVEHYTDIQDEANYTKGDNIEDPGLLYILNKSRILGGEGITPEDVAYTAGSGYVYEGTARNIIEIYATQISIWVYMYEKYYLLDNAKYPMHSLAYFGSEHSTANTNYEIIKAANYLSVTNYDQVSADLELDRDFYAKYINPVVSAAKNYTGVKKLNVSKANNTISKVGDDTYYQSAVMSVAATPSDDLVSFDVSVSGIESAFVVDENGNRKETGFAPGSKFYVRVPTKDVTQQVSKVTVTVKGKFDNYLSGSYYTSDSLQKVVAVTGQQNYETANLTLDFVGSPNTGMSKAQTVFFIGLVVLLCGVGIIYANAKPVEVQS